MQTYASHTAAGLVVAIAVIALFFTSSIPSAAAQSSQVAAEWALFNEILIIGIIVGIIVYGLLFYAIIRYREKPRSEVAK